jgi:hypothetical protein
LSEKGEILKKCCVCGSVFEEGELVPALILTEARRRVLADFGINTRTGDCFTFHLPEPFQNMPPEELLCLGYLRLSLDESEGSGWYCRVCLENLERFSAKGHVRHDDEERNG